MIVARTILPWPPSNLSPNGSQKGLRGKRASARAYKGTCAAIMREKGRAVQKLPAGTVVERVTLTYCPPPRVRLNGYDFDNMGKRMKQGLDALAEAIGVDDGEWLELLQKRGERCRDGAVIVEIEVE